MADEYKALTVINLPFIEKRFLPGSMIPYSDFQESAEMAASVLDDRSHVDPDASPILTADEQISYFMEWGSISDDPDAELHPDHRPVDPGKPSLAAMVEQAKALVEELEANGHDVPAKLRDFAETSDRQISAVDHAEVGDRNE